MNTTQQKIATASEASTLATGFLLPDRSYEYYEGRVQGTSKNRTFLMHRHSAYAFNFFLRFLVGSIGILGIS
jgi:hypothetical protein